MAYLFIFMLLSQLLFLSLLRSHKMQAVVTGSSYEWPLSGSYRLYRTLASSVIICMRCGRVHDESNLWFASNA